MAGKVKESAPSFWSKTSNSGVPQSGSSALQYSSVSGTQGSSSVAVSQSGTRGSSSGAASQSGTRGSSSGAPSQSGTNNGNPYAHSTDQATSKTSFGAPSPGNHGNSLPGFSQGMSSNYGSGFSQGMSSNYGSGFSQQISSLGKNSANHTKPCTACPGLKQQLANEKAAVKKLQGELEREKAAVKRAEVRKKETEPRQTFKPELKTEKDAAPWLKIDTERALLKKVEELTKQLREAQIDLKSSVESRTELQRSYDQLDRKNKGLNRSKTMVEVYEIYRRQSEDQSYRPPGTKKYDSWELDIPVKRPNKEYIGTTRYGAVYKSILDLKDVVVEIPNNRSQQMQQDFNQKVDILTRLRHPNLVSYIGAYEKEYALVCEDFPKVTLQDRLVDKSHEAPFSWEERVRISASICSTLLFLHISKPRPIIHGDLKAQNIFFGKDNVCRLSVFGVSHPTQQTTTNNKAPSIQSDICAFGIILLQIVTGQGEKDLVRKKVLSMGDANQFQQKGREWQREVLTKKQILDVRLDDCPTEDAVKMLVLGLRCSHPEENQRPDLATEVWTQIQSMRSRAIPSGLFGR